MKSTHAKVLTGLGCTPGEYEIKLREGVTPFNLTTPRELKRMEDMGVIEKVVQPTEWCFPVVVIPKKVRICGDVIQLNKSMLWENHTMPTTEQTLAKLAGAKIFNRLDADLRVWQRKLSVNSKHLTTFITTWERYCYTWLPLGISLAPEYFKGSCRKS